MFSHLMRSIFMYTSKIFAWAINLLSRCIYQPIEGYSCSFKRAQSSAVSVILALVAALSATTSATRVTTTFGALEGSSYVNSRGRQIYTFLGVPYAQPPVRERRFEEPQPLKNWTGVWPAVVQPPHCIQYQILTREFEGEEDCLYLNIYTPTVSKANLPVLIYIHGGAFTYQGTSPYKATSLLEDHNIVFVTCGYRLGPFGFLSTEDAEVPGNAGLKDQAMALRWVHDNIEHFGGDKNRVTISGNSAGGASVHYHYFSRLSRGLFTNGITSSGSALNAKSFTEGALQKAKLLSDSVGCPTDNTTVMIDCLRCRPSRQILSTMPLFIPWGINPSTPFGPVVEKCGKNPFLHEHPLRLLLERDVFDAPLLAGVTKEEGLYPVATFIDEEGQLQYLNERWNCLAPHLLDYNYTTTPDNVLSVNERVRKFYFGSEAISDLTQDRVTKMAGDRLFYTGMDLAMRLHASVVSSNLFLFKFGYRGRVSLSDKLSKTKANFGVSHFDDMYYVLTSPGSEELTGEEEKRMKKIMTSMWVSFMKSGKPLVSNMKWDPIPKSSFETGNLPYMFIKSPSEILMESSDDFGNRTFWGSLGLNENTIYLTLKDAQ